MATGVKESNGFLKLCFLPTWPAGRRTAVADRRYRVAVVGGRSKSVGFGRGLVIQRIWV
jgi:hypothetical protein